MSPVGGRPYSPRYLPPARYLSFHNPRSVRPMVHRSARALGGQFRSERLSWHEYRTYHRSGWGVRRRRRLGLTVVIAVWAAQAGPRPVALDGDRLGGGLDGGLDVALGLEQECGARWPDRGCVEGLGLLRRLPSVDGVSFGRTRDVPLAAQIVQEVLRGLSGPVDGRRSLWTCLFWQWSVRNRRWSQTCFMACRQEALPGAHWLPRPTACWRGVSSQRGGGPRERVIREGHRSGRARF
jgi:hypothetical protein